MTTRVPIPASDQTWLHMDRPNNLMYVHSLMWFEEAPTLEAVRDLLQHRVVDRYPVFHRRAVEHGGAWFWEDVPDFDIAWHLSETTLDGTAEDLRAYISARFSELFDFDHPLWSMEVIHGVDDFGTAILARFHHALADGVRLTQLMLSMCDVAEDPDATDALPQVVGRGGAHHGLVAAGVEAVRRGVGDVVDFAAGVGAETLRLPVRAVSLLTPSAFEQGLGLVLHPSRLLDAVGALSSEDNQSVNTLTEVTRMLSATRSVHTFWSGTPGVEKRVSWVTGLDLDVVKQRGREHDGTVNDLLMALISRALTRYLEAHDAVVDEIAWLVPVSLVPLDANLPEELGNHFALIYVPMPLGIADTATLVAAVRSRMTRLKHSAEPVVAFGLQWVVAESPKAISVWITNLFANKVVGVLTNVPGPRRPMTFAGVPVTGSLGWAPTSGDQPLSLAIFSYNGAVNIGIAADASLIPDPDRIADLLREEFELL